MKGELIFLLIAVLIAGAVVGLVQLHKHRNMIKMMFLNWFDRVVLKRMIRILQSWRGEEEEPAQTALEISARQYSEQQQSKKELERIQNIIEVRKQLAKDTDISYHLWSFYDSHFRNADEQTAIQPAEDGEWYDFRILKAGTRNNLNEFEFEMKGARYRFVDNEETQPWALSVKVFSLFLYDDEDRCLIEVPIKLHVDSTGRRYTIHPGGPKAFLPGDWTREFISTKLKHQRIRNQEIRAQKHQERLSEIDDLKDRFGIKK